MEPKKQIGTYVPMDLYDAFCRYHKDTGVAKIKILEFALREYLSKHASDKQK